MSLTAVVLILACGWLTLLVAAQVRSGRDGLIARAAGDIDVLAILAARELGRLVEAKGAHAGTLVEFAGILPASALAGRRRLMLAANDGTILSSLPAVPPHPTNLTQLFGPLRPLPGTTGRDAARLADPADGAEIVATIRTIPGGYVALTQPTSAILSGSTSLQDVLGGGLGLALVGCCGLLVLRRARRHTEGGTSDDNDNVTASMEHGRCGLWSWDIAHGRIAWSDSMYRLLGYERQGDHLSFGELDALIHPGDVDLYRIAEDVAAGRRTRIDCAFRMRTQEGRWMWLRTRADGVEDAAGRCRLVGVAVDITTERERLEDNASANTHLRDAIEAISEAFVVWDADNRLVLCNSKFRKLHDLPGEILVAGATYSDIMRAGRPPVVQHQLSHPTACISGGRTMEAQLADGRWLHINERRTREGGFVSVGTDITDLKRHEVQLLKSEGRLLNTVADLRMSRQTLEMQKQQLAELAERNLEQKAEAESANRTKTEFLAKMSHELRTPLNAIINFADIMQSGMFGPIDSRYASYSRDIHTSGLYLLSVINDILDMSKIEAGRMKLDLAPTTLAAPVHRAVAMIGEQARAKGVALNVCLRGDRIVAADERGLHQILTNLLQNAVKFTHRGGSVNLRIRGGRGGVNIFVEDTGIGIPAGALATIGRPFEQVENEFSRSHKGSGLGLAIARSLTVLHGGNLRIRSQQGLGTIVLVHLPAGDAVETEPHLRYQAA